MERKERKEGEGGKRCEEKKTREVKRVLTPLSNAFCGP
jgi:hypothetical protein